MAPLPPPDPLPEFVYKITPTAPPDPIPEQYPLSDLDRQDGFIPITADLFFKDFTSFYILKLRLANFDQSSVKWDEVDGTNGCPHLYGNFGVKDVVAAKEFRRAEGQSWKDVFEREKGWLE
ncbi:hypothetical protein MYCTH_45679 [Thermothelomyces thermophilus ATCC 42464]|uniref:Uncharacterized protein n=1 Tax=Thermothelomyces thermophilus (strain ATCC 42464 / BCRC 31852 / DSM 1799) TaxID=573729 RepID=G2Q7J5_THET4|nr:uncharacterized protein MYCTH_45679 [Thermothelomyces thermophilus ATCC 42464]AEO56053.1 hypothetical protein MYCTH_45679 [Thermothelomyces thermophilus ATCC 42464]